MYHKLIFAITFQMCLPFSFALHFVVHPDRDLSIAGVTSKYGYPLESHEFVTDDGYILTMHRIPRGRNNTSTGSNNKYPVLIVHGTCGCVENFILLGPEKSIAYYLADRGFDVWMLSTRGSRYSRKHRTLNPDTDKEFWNFGWHEIAVIDTPSSIDYILETTNNSKLFYIGHSQGGTTYFAFASERPEYNSKILLSVNMAPSCFMGYVRNFIMIMSKHNALIQLAANFFHVYEVFPNRYTELLNDVAKILCSEMSLFIDICKLILYFGEIDGDMAETTPQLLFSRSPAHCSLKQIIHFFQITKSGLFSKFDYGAKRNLRIYGTKYPPVYSFSNITAPVALFYSVKDTITPEEGIHKMAKLLPNVVALYAIPSVNFGHIDFIIGETAPRLVYQPIYELFKAYL